MMRFGGAILVSSLLLAARPVVADDKYSACVDTTSTNDEWAKCGAEFVQREEAVMGEAWQRLMELTEGNTKAALEAEQHGWSAFRQKACHFYADPEAFGREGQVLSFPNCVAETVAGRTAQLKAYLREIDP